ncbi:MAG: ThiF family adenylyltransferase, partial [Aggregatilineales bacterium]
MNSPRPFDFHQQITEVVVVGLGGSGSQVARSVCRILYDLRRRGHYTPRLKFIDPECVEAKNVGRQMFTDADVGKPKAAVLAARFNLAMGFAITAYVEPFDANTHLASYGTLVVGCVDNHVASQNFCTERCEGKSLISQFLRRYSRNSCTNPARVSQYLHE